MKETKMKQVSKKVLFVLAALMLFAGLFATIFKGAECAQAANLHSNQMAMTNIFHERMRGRIWITGNTLSMPDSRYYTRGQINSYGATGAGGRGSSQNNDLYMNNYDADLDPTTRNSSAVGISLGSTERIHKAYLIWGGTSLAGDSTRPNGNISGSGPQEAPRSAPEAEVAAGPAIKFKTPGMTSYVTVMPTKSNRLTAYRKDYSAYADVTEYVKQAGAGTYWAGDIPLSSGYDTYGGWSLVIVYADPSLKEKNDLNVFFGHRVVDRTNPTEVQLTGLITPPAGEVKARIGFVSWEGDQAGTGDFVRAMENPVGTDADRLYDSLTPKDNFMNSAVAYDGQVISNRTPNFTNTHGLDAKVINYNGRMRNNQDKLSLYMSTTSDTYYLSVLTTEVQQYAPNVEVKKSCVNLTRPGAKKAIDGDVLEYTVTFKNTGYDTATLNYATDNLPSVLNYVPNSIVRMNGDQRVPLTDNAGDDDAEYQEGNRKIALYIGDGATPEQGGSLAHDQSTVYKYHATVTQTGASSSIINTVDIRYEGSDGETSSGGSSSDRNEIEAEPWRSDFTLTKTTDRPSGYDLKVGDLITYTFTLKNTGNVPLSNIALEDPLPNMSPMTYENPSQTTLAASGESGDTMVAHATYTVTQADVDRGSLKNTATATARDERGTVLTRQGTAILPAEHNPAVTLKKTADKTTLVAGETITYSFEVENTGNVTLSGVTLTDQMQGLTFTQPLNKTELAPGEKTQATATYTVTQKDVDAKKVTNTAEVKGNPPAVDGVTPTPITASDSVTVYAPPVLPSPKRDLPAAGDMLPLVKDVLFVGGSALSLAALLRRKELNN